eukprot:1160247-Pelagomonas_calceolata.AAC.29
MDAWLLLEREACETQSACVATCASSSRPIGTNLLTNTHVRMTLRTPAAALPAYAASTARAAAGPQTCGSLCGAGPAAAHHCTKESATVIDGSLAYLAQSARAGAMLEHRYFCINAGRARSCFGAFPLLKRDQ